MQKLLALVLALVCLCTLLPAAAEEAPALNLPMTVEAYMDAYTTVLTDVAEGCTVTWSSAAMEEGVCWMATVNGSITSVMVLAVDGQASEVAVLLQSDLTEDTLLTFLSMAGYAGAALLKDEDTTSVQACDAFVNEVFNVFTAIYEGNSPDNIYGLPGALNISIVEEGVYQYYFIIKLDAAQ